MPRQNRRQPATPLRGIGGADARRETFRGVDHLVRPVAGAHAAKAYRCPGCQQEIPPGRPHVVAWPDDGVGGAADRRHWHTACWAARDRR